MDSSIRQEQQSFSTVFNFINEEIKAALIIFSTIILFYCIVLNLVQILITNHF